MPDTHESFCLGVRHERARIGVDLLADKIIFIKALYQAAAKKAEDPSNGPQWEPYSEGLRHALNIMQNLGSPEEVYRNIISPSVPILSEIPPAYEGH